MHSDENDIWYRIGYALERVRRAPDSVPALETLLSTEGAPGGGSGRSRRSPSGQSGEESAGGGRPSSSGKRGNPDSSGGNALVRMLAAGGARSLTARILRLWPARDRVGVLDLAAAGASGATMAVLVDLVAPLLQSDEGRHPDGQEVATTALEGVVRGLTYGGVVEPRLPGPAFLLGFVYGSAEYLAASRGGLPALLRSVSPHGKIPFLSRLADPGDDGDRTYLEYVLFGLALAILYDSVRSKRGIEDDE